VSERPVELHELFDPDDTRDRWVFMLAAVVADLATMETTFKSALHGEGSHPAHRFYLQRQLSARIVEADRVVLAIPSNQPIEKFINRIRARSEADWLIARYTKGETDESEIDRALRSGRHRAVHHARLNGEDLRATLELTRDEAVVVERDEAQRREIFEFPEAVLTRFVFAGEDGNLDEKVMRERAALCDEVLKHFGALWLIVWPAHVRGKGVDPRRLYRIARDEGDQGT
jgi:hypothetical protein